MPRYGGGHEDFAEQERRLARMSERLAAIEAKEAAATAAMEDLGVAEQRATTRRRTLNRAKNEGLEITEREAAVANQEARAVDVDTAAIERNRIARERRSTTLAREATAQQVAAARAAQAGIVGGRGDIIVRDPSVPTSGGGRQAYTGVRTSREAVEGGIQPGLAATRAARVAQLQAEAKALGMTAEASQVYSSALGREQRALLLTSTAAANEATGQIAARSARNVGALRQEGVALSTVSQAMHKHGALTSEFILAAARGETTLKELGNQALITAGKFGGWTAAATGLFAAAGAIQQIGHGAIAASGGVHTLQRVINSASFTPDEAQAGFADLAREFNVPIETAIDAVYRMGQRFHEFPQAMEAARASLYSFKTGEVDVATSTENLLAIVNGFGLSSQDLASVYDQINQAQNTFGIRIGDTEAGLAKAAGTYRNAGGDLDYLLGLTIAIGRATNRSGQEIGTGLARGVNEIRKSVNQAKLEAQGVDVIPENFQKTLQSGLKAAQRPGADLQQIASGLFGNQYARLIAPVLADQRVLNQALKDTTPEQSKGSAQKELGKVLKQADEQIKALGISLQALGAGLSRSGAFNFAGLLLHGLNDVLSLAVKLVDVFNKIPSPLREGVVMAGELALVIKGLQRFGATERFAGGALGFLAAPDQQFASKARSGRRGARDAARDEQESTARRSYTATNAFTRSEKEAQRAVDDRAALSRRAATAEEHIAANERVAVANATMARQEVRMVEAAQASADARLLAAAAEEEYTAAANLSNKALAQRARAGIPVPLETDRPSSAGTTNPPGVVGRGPGTGAREVEALARAEQEAALLASAQPRVLTERAARVQERLYRYSDAVTPGLRRLGVTGGLLASGTERVAQAGTAAANSLGRVPGGLSRVGSSAMRMLRSLGPLDVALIGFIVFSELDNKLDALAKNLDDAEQTLGSFSSSAPNAAKRLGDTAEKLQGGQLSDIASLANDLANPVNIPGNLIKSLQGNYEAPQRRRERLLIEAEMRASEADHIKELQREARSQGRALPQLTYRQAISRIKHDQDLRRAGVISEREFDRRMALHATEVQTLLDPGANDVSAARNALTDATREAGGLAAFRKSLIRLDAKSLQAQVEAIGTNAQSFGATPRDMGRLRALYDQQVANLSGKGDAASIAALSEARNAFAKTIIDNAQAELKVALRSEGGEGSRQAAYRRAAKEIRRNVLSRARNQLRNAEAARDEAQEHADDARANARIGLAPDARPRVLGMPVGEVPTAGDLTRTALTAGKRLNELKKAANVRRKEVVAAARIYQDALADLKDAGFQDRTEGRDIQAALAQSRTSDPVEGARIGVRFARLALADARHTYGNKGREYAKALTAMNNAEKELSTAVRDYGSQLADALDQLAVARAGGDPVAAARAAQASGRRQLGRATNQLERVQALISITQANDQLQDAIRDQEAARFNLLSSQTTDPVQQAHIETRRARAAISGTTGAERLNARAEYNRAKQSERDARLSARESDIDFEQTMGRITVQDAIDRYRALLHIRNLTKQQKRDIQLKIHQLQSDSEGEASGFDLDVGSIKLPTIYDVRRAFDPVRRQVHASQRAVLAEAGSQSADIRNNVSHMYDARSQVQANIRVVVNDPNAAGEVFEAIDRALGTSVRARMRSRGLRGA